MSKIFKPFIWCALSFIFGLLQVWYVLGYSVLDKSFMVDFNKIILGCGLMFFCSALVAGRALDFFTHNKKKFSDLGYIGLAYAFYPAVILITATLVYNVCLRGSPEIKLITNVQFVILAMSLAYAFIEKMFSFKTL